MDNENTVEEVRQRQANTCNTACRESSTEALRRMIKNKHEELNKLSMLLDSLPRVLSAEADAALYTLVMRSF